MSPTAITSYVREAAIRQRVADWAAAISAKDIEAVASVIIAINGWNRVAIPFRAEVGSYQPSTAEAVH